MEKIGALSRKILQDVQLERAKFGRDPGTEAPGQVFRAETEWTEPLAVRTIPDLGEASSASIESDAVPLVLRRNGV